MISCDECQKKMVAVFDNEGGKDDEKLIDVHLKDCCECRVFREDMVRIRQQFASAPLPGLSPAVRQELVQEVQSDSMASKSLCRDKKANRQPLMFRFPALARACGLAALFLIAVSWIVSFNLSGKVRVLTQELEASRQEIALAHEKERLEEAQERQQKAISALYFRMQELEQRVDRSASTKSAFFPAERNGI